MRMYATYFRRWLHVTVIISMCNFDGQYAMNQIVECVHHQYSVVIVISLILHLTLTGHDAETNLSAEPKLVTRRSTAQPNCNYMQLCRVNPS